MKDIILKSNTIQLLPLVTRVEVIDNFGRKYVNWHKNNIVELSLQDDNKTLKIFIKNEDNI